MNRYDRLSPNQALAEAASILSCTSPRDIWSLCALLSVTEYFGEKRPNGMIFFPALNHEKIRLLCEACLDSKALDYKSRDISAFQINDALNYSNRALTDYETMHLIDQLRELRGSELALRVYSSRLGNIQMRYQDPRFHERLGRLIGMIEVLPQSHRHRMSPAFWAMADPVLDAIRNFLEFPLLSLAAGVVALLESYDRPYQSLLAQYSPLASAKASPKKCFLTLLEGRQQFQPSFILGVERSAERTVIDRFLELFARTTRELRDLRQSDFAYRRGSIARRLSPLERYPVVLLTDTEVVIPNVRYLYRNFADIIRFSLSEAKIPGYDDVRGGLQELYLQVLLEARLPNIVTIPERSYHRKKQEVRGPDITLVEDDRLIIIESKAQRIRAETRLNMLPENLLDNLGGAVKAIAKSGTKIEDLYAGLPEFADVQGTIDKTRARDPITVAVVGEDVAMMGEVLREMEKSYPDNPLADVRGLYCILGIDAFERAVEVAAMSGKKLGNLLEEYIGTAEAGRHDAPLVDGFGGGVELGNALAISFFSTQNE